MSSIHKPVSPSLKPSPTLSCPPAFIVVDTPQSTDMVLPLLIACYMAAQQLPHYAKGDFKLWLCKFKNHFTLFRVPDNEKLLTVAQFLDDEAAKWHNNLSYKDWDDWRKAAIKQFVPCEAKPLTLLRFIKLSLYNIFPEFITAFCKLVKQTLDKQNEDLNDNKAKVAISCFDKYYGIPFLQDALLAIYACFLHQEGPENLADAYDCILTQYQDCLEDEPDENEWKSQNGIHSVKRRPSKRLKLNPLHCWRKLQSLNPSWYNTLWAASLTCYNCHKLGHIAANCPVKQCGYCGVENEHTSNKCPARLTHIKPKISDSMFVELMAVEKRNTKPPVQSTNKHPRLVSPIIEQAKRMLSSCTPLDPKRTCIQELTPTRAPSPVQMTKKGVPREDAPSPEDNAGMRAHLKTFEDAIQQLMDKLANLSEALGKDQHIAIENKISEQLDEDMTKLSSLQSDPESMPVPVEDLISQEQLLDAKFEDDSFDQKGDTPQKSEPIQMVSPKVSVETVPESVCPPSK
ncbi:hypothetical protein DSO57_1009053 [Entomophthora muscae]|uniref:Uncharacterized protein n=1 Tax=Entomophthora muscae TaxID=34485 RepID=A0ACC2RLY1_9FUNG|nr:hypothetical protein DSO57_1009053 [Entomophthora muscae]